MRARQWRSLERRAVVEHERDLLAAVDELCARHPVVTGIEVDPLTGRTAKIELGDRPLVLGSSRRLAWRCSPGVGATAESSGSTRSVATAPTDGSDCPRRPNRSPLLSYTLKLSSNDGGAPATPARWARGD